MHKRRDENPKFGFYAEMYQAITMAGIEFQVDYDKVFVSPWLEDKEEEKRHSQLMNELIGWPKKKDQTKDRVDTSELHLEIPKFYFFRLQLF